MNANCQSCPLLDKELVWDSRSMPLQCHLMDVLSCLPCYRYVKIRSCCALETLFQTLYWIIFDQVCGLRCPVRSLPVIDLDGSFWIELFELYHNCPLGQIICNAPYPARLINSFSGCEIFSSESNICSFHILFYAVKHQITVLSTLLTSLAFSELHQGLIGTTAA